MRLLSRWNSGNLRDRSISASVWTFSGFGVQQVLRLVSNLIMTRLLVPEAFGLMALVHIFLMALELISDVGIAPSVVRSKRNDHDFLSTAWTLSWLRGLILMIAAILIAYPFSILYEEPILFGLIAVSSVTVFLKGFNSINITLRTRDLVLKRVIFWEIGVQITAIIINITAVWILQSVWGLVVGVVIVGIVQTASSLLVFPSEHHKFRLERPAIKEIIAFGKWVLLGTLFTFAANHGLQLIWGQLVTLEVLGMLSLATFLGWAIGDLIGKMLGRIVFPALAEIVRERPEEIGRVTRKVKMIQVVLTTPAFLALSFFAVPLIDFLYDDRYMQVGLFLEIMALNSAISALPMIYQNALLALGNSRLHFNVMAASAVLRVIGTIVGFHFAGAIGMVFGVGVGSFLVYIYSAYIANQRGFLNLGQDLTVIILLVIGYSLQLNF